MVLVIKNLPGNAGDIRDAGSIPGLGRFSGEGNGHPFQYSCLENSTDKGTWHAAVHGLVKCWKQLSDSQSLTPTRKLGFTLLSQ